MAYEPRAVVDELVDLVVDDVTDLVEGLEEPESGGRGRAGAKRPSPLPRAAAPLVVDITRSSRRAGSRAPERAQRASLDAALPEVAAARTIEAVPGDRRERGA